jgi:hypothetical protein
MALPPKEKVDLVYEDHLRGDVLNPEQLAAMEIVISKALGGDGTRGAEIFKICCRNSKRKPSQLTPRFIMQLGDLGEADHSDFSRLRLKVNALAEHAGESGPAVLIRFPEKRSYAVSFEPNEKALRARSATASPPPISADRFVTLDGLVQLERSVDDGGHLVSHGTLIIQGDAPFILKPAVARVAVDNMSKGFGYQFVFQHDQPEHVAAVVSSLLSTDSIQFGIEANIERIGKCLEIWVSEHLWPFVISVHNAGDKATAKSYIIVEETKPEVLFQLASGERAQQIAQKINSLCIRGTLELDQEGWMQSPVSDQFQLQVMDGVRRKLHLTSNKEVLAKLKNHMFGSPKAVSARGGP